VSRFQPGAAVFGSSEGALADYVSVPADVLARKPSKLSFTEAATVALPGSTALRALRKAQVRAGHHVLVVGASGGSGFLLSKSLKPSARTSPASAARRTSISYSRWAPITPSTTPRTTSSEVARASM
jgi:D-arabinose 1-dehydrogenase-like Zn-dependent alcohol dehydrogenase